MKSTLLECASELTMPKEHRLSQGHHRNSALLYSRNETFSSLLVQRTICTSIAGDFRPERSMARGGQAPFPETPFSVPAMHPEPALPPSDMHAGPWAPFTSRHVQLRAAADPQIKLKQRKAHHRHHSRAGSSRGALHGHRGRRCQGMGPRPSQLR